MKKVSILALFSILLVSCVDPICREYIATVSIKNISLQKYECVAVLMDDKNKESVVVANLDQSNNFSDVYEPWHMGDQIDLRYPYEKYGDEEFQSKLDQIRVGGIYTIYERAGGLVPKYTIECTPEDVKEIIDDRLYRCYEITLDWNKRAPIAE